MKYITHITAAVAGAIIIATAFLGYTFYKALAVVSQNNATIQYLFNADQEGIRGIDKEVVGVINKIQQPSK